MDYESRAGLAEFRNSLAPEFVRSLAIVQGAIGGGILVFALVVLWMSTTSSPGPVESSPVLALLMQILTLAHLVVAIVLFPLAHIIFARILSPERLRKAAQSGPGSVLSLMRTAIVVRLALYEAVAFFGLMVCLVGAIRGILAVEPIYWVNGISAAVMLLFIVRTFPTKERLVALYEERSRG
jgi:hypothetical protein